MKLPREVQAGIAQRRAQESNVKNILMVSDAAQRMVGALGSAANSYMEAKDQAKLTGVTNNSLNEYEKLLAYIENAESFDINNDEVIPKELRDEIVQKINVDKKELESVDGRAFVPAFEARGIIHDYHIKKIKEKGYSLIGANNKLKNKYDQAINSRASKAVSAIVEHNLKDEIEQLSAQGDMRYSLAVQSGDVSGAYSVIEDMARVGLWSPEKVAKHVKTVEGDIEYNQSIQGIVSGDATAIRGIEASLASGKSKMSNTQKIDVSARANVALDRKLEEREEEVKLISDGILNDNLVMLGREGVLGFDYVETLKGSMTPEDYRTLINANRAAVAGGRAVHDDPSFVRRMSGMIGRLSIPSDTPYSLRKAQVINSLHEAMGYDPTTKSYTGVAVLKRETYFSLLDQVNKADKRVLDDPRMDMLIDSTYKKLTGGSREMISFADDVSANVLMAIEYENDMMHAALEAGPSFDPQVWHDSHWIKYASEALSSNYDTLIRRRVMNFGVLQSGKTAIEADGANMDIPATTDAIKQAFNDGVLDAGEATEMFNVLHEFELTQELAESRRKEKEGKR